MQERTMKKMVKREEREKKCFLNNLGCDMVLFHIILVKKHGFGCVQSYRCNDGHPSVTLYIAKEHTQKAMKVRKIRSQNVSVK